MRLLGQKSKAKETKLVDLKATATFTLSKDGITGSIKFNPQAVAVLDLTPIEINKKTVIKSVIFGDDDLHGQFRVFNSTECKEIADVKKITKTFTVKLSSTEVDSLTLSSKLTKGDYTYELKPLPKELIEGTHITVEPFALTPLRTYTAPPKRERSAAQIIQDNDKRDWSAQQKALGLSGTIKEYWLAHPKKV